MSGPLDGLDRVVVVGSAPVAEAADAGLHVVRVEVGPDEDDMVDRLVKVVGDGRRTLLTAAGQDEATRRAAVIAASRTGARLASDPTDAVHATDTALDDLHAQVADPWGVDSRFYETRKRDLLLAALPRATFRHGLEIGSSTGALAADLATRCRDLLVVDASPHALEAARTRLVGVPQARLEQLTVPREWPRAPADGFDLVVLSEVGYFLSPVALDHLVERIRGDLAADGVLVLCHWRHAMVGWPLDGPAVHSVVTAAGLRPVVATYVDRDVELLVLADPAVLPDPLGS